MNYITDRGSHKLKLLVTRIIVDLHNIFRKCNMETAPIGSISCEICQKITNLHWNKNYFSDYTISEYFLTQKVYSITQIHLSGFLTN